MRPLLFFWGGGEGGDAAVAIALAAALKQSGIRSVLAAYAYARPEVFKAKACAAGLVAGKGLYLVSEPERLWEETQLKRTDFDLIHVHHGRTVPKRTDIVPLKHIAGNLPLIITAHGPLPLSSIQYGGIKSKLSRILSPLWFDAVVVPSEAKAREWRKMTPLAKKVRVIPNIVSFLAPMNKAQARAEAGLDPEAEIVLFCSRLDPDKDPLLFIEALARAGKIRPGILGIMAGNGELADECDRLIRELSAPIRRVGYVSDPAPYYNSADVFVQPSLYESFGITLLHAVDLGLLCVASKIEVFHDLYEETPSLRWFLPGDSEGCAEAIVRQLESKGNEWPSKLRERFSARPVVNAHLELWESILERKWVGTVR